MNLESASKENKHQQRGGKEKKCIPIKGVISVFSLKENAFIIQTFEIMPTLFEGSVIQERLARVSILS